MGSSSRFGGQIARSPISDKTPNVFGVSPVSEVSPTPFGSENSSSEPIQVSLATRSTSPTPPCNSSFLRARRADMDRVDIEVVSRPHYRPVCVSSETQTDDGKKPSWGSRSTSGGGSSSSASSSTTSAASRGYRGYIRPGDLPVAKKQEPPPPPERKDVVSRVGGLSLNRPTDLPLVKTPSFIRSGDSRSPSYKSPLTSVSDANQSISVNTAESKSPRRTPDEQETKQGFRAPPTNSNLESKAGDNRNFLSSKPPDPPTRSASKIDLRPPVPKIDTTKSSDPSKSPSKSELPKSPSKSTLKPSKSNVAVPAALKKSTTTASVLQPLPNKDFRKSVLNMDLTKKDTSSSESSSEETTSSEESSDDDEPKSNDSRYLTASRTTAQMSSADEVSSISLDRPPKPPGKKDEPKAVVVKTMTTATPMKVSFGPAEDELKKPFQLRRFDSGQTDWWASSGSDKKGCEKPGNNEEKSTLKVPGTTTSDNSDKKMYKLRKFDSGQADWWKSSKDVPSSLSNSQEPSDKQDKDESSSSYKRIPMGKAPSSASISKSGLSLQNIPSSVNFEKSENQVVNLNKTPSSSSLQKSPSSLSLPKVASDGSLQKTGSVSSLPFDEEKSPSPTKPALARTRSSASLQKTGSNASLQKTGSNVSLQKSVSGASLQKTPSNASLPKTGSNGSIHKSASNASLLKSGSNASLQKSGSNADLSKLDNGGSLQRAPSGANLPKSPSSANLSAKPPLALKTDCQEVLEAKEHTPAFLRLHKKYGQAAAESWNRRRLVRVESGERDWWLSDEEKAEEKKASRPSEVLGKVYCGLYTNIDHVLGTQAPPPAAFNTPDHSSDDDSSDEEFWREVKPTEVKVHEPVVQPEGMIKLDDTALQLYKDGDYGSYLDLESSINEQQEEFESFNSNRKNSIVLRTQLSVRVHAIIEKLLNSEGRDLRRALFSLKQIFQEDKDLVHEFVQNDGLACLIKVGNDADQNYQNYILRALGQVMLYVDGMNGVMEHPLTIQWLYGLVSSKFRLVVKTALKLLLVFVEYTYSNSVLLVKAVKAVDYVHTCKPWTNLMKLMKDYDSADTEILIYAMTLINKTLNGLPDQDMYYDQVDALEEQGMENIIRKYMSKQGTDLDLLRQFQIYEAVLAHEDGDDEKTTPLRQLDEALRKSLKNRKSLTATLHPDDRRKSRRRLIGSSPVTLTLTPTRIITPPLSPDILAMNDVNGVGVTPGLRRRRERAERHKSFIKEQQEAGKGPITLCSDDSSPPLSVVDDRINNNNNINKVVKNNETNNNYNTAVTAVVTVKNGEVTLDLTPTNKQVEGLNGHEEDSDGQEEGRASVKDLTQKLASSLGSPSEETKTGPFGDMKGIISKAKEELAKSQSQHKMTGGLGSPGTPTPPPPPPEIKKSEAELQWEALKQESSRPLKLCDLNFEDLGSDEERDVLAPAGVAGGIPPPPPPGLLPPMAPAGAPGPPPAMMQPPPVPSNSKTKKTVKLFWKEVRDDPIVVTKIGPGSLIWDELTPVTIDTQKLEHLFESRAKDLITKKQQEMNKNKEVIVLDHKRSNAINIGMTKLPPPRSIKTAILKMDATVMNREGIEKLLTMLPTEEEISKIQEAQSTNPDLPLGSAEQFLLTLASISELPARLKLWAFKLDYENLEKEIAEPLMDLKQGMESLRSNRTFRAILGTLLSIGIFLNGSEVKGFQIEYLAKVPEVKDTVHKHTLLHHLCHMVMEKFPDATDLYSEIGAVTRASKVDFDELSGNISKMEQECKASFEHLKVISTHDGTTSMKLKMSDFLADCAERIIILDKIHRRVLNRYHKFCLWVGVPLHRVSLTKPDQLCRIISEFALEYRTTRERVIQQLEKKASHRERNKTRGKMITEVGKMRSQEDCKDAELKQLLGHNGDAKNSMVTHGGSLPWRRTKKDITTNNNSISYERANGNLTDADDEILETLVKTATKTPVSRTMPRERKRTRNADRKSLVKRSRTRENLPEGGNVSP
uniref:FH1/FH2 domain-containing protein 3 n=1 Tax=Lygus hesperus TaxID=30085 RepID=A0A0A9WQT4_LYGHE